MLRITEVNSSTDQGVLKLEGRLAGAWVPELSRVVGHARARANGSRLVLDLAGVTFVDQAGIALLRLLSADCVDFRGASAFVSGLVRGEHHDSDP